MVSTHNASESSYKLGHNEFSDWSKSEWDNFNTYKEQEPSPNETLFKSINSASSVPIDWRSLGAVNTPVKQGCGDCWAHSSTGALEGGWFVRSGKLTKFAEQQLIDCVTNCNGCNGGNY